MDNEEDEEACWWCCIMPLAPPAEALPSALAARDEDGLCWAVRMAGKFDVVLRGPGLWGGGISRAVKVAVVEGGGVLKVAEMEASRRRRSGQVDQGCARRGLHRDTPVHSCV